jgi:urease accessory protein
LSELPRTGLSGNLHLVFSAHPQRGTFIARQSFSAPMHISKAYWNGDALLVNVINPTAGVFGGDSITSQIVIESGARVLLSSPSAARFHPSHGRESRLEQAFEVRAGGFLDVYPEISIPQRDSRSFQKTSIQMEHGGELIFLETLTPGRVASGEAFAFSRYGWATDIRVGNQLVHRERASISPEGKSSTSLRAFFPNSYYAGIVLISPAAEDWKVDFAEAVRGLEEASSVRIAASRLNAHGWSFRLLARDSLALRESIRKLRGLLYQRLGRSAPDSRRNEM